MKHSFLLKRFEEELDVIYKKMEVYKMFLNKVHCNLFGSDITYN
jgi:hypothetical protein